MKESIYACLFSSGLIKVGRSIDPVSRMASHASRVSCAGILLVETHHAECAGSPCVAERLLIKRCRSMASKQHKFEWFDGLVFSDVALLIDEISKASKEDVSKPTVFGMWQLIITDLLNSGMSQREIAKKIGGSESRVSEMLSGAIKSLRYEHGVILVSLHESLGYESHDPRCGTKKAA